MQDIIIGSDHRGYELKQKIKDFLKERKLFYIDVGVQSADKPTDGDTSVPIINVIREVAECVQGAKNMCGILICGNGIGMSIGANRFKGVRGALCRTADDATQARQHNDANLLCLGGDTTDFETAKRIINNFINTKFQGEVARYKKRVAAFDTL